ncbi:uncharacterized protein KY384_004800 [Bacidia gigantensis]|uniref:uncharacterized protein n=1 Tax=Bacidia gigantensis TaxID=2732470 RepID=UPI001D04E595|nr:uncharacterized protein KY384_004800 [Bacidia gigantensis]KAG8530298.1 hypothetical protein KY384_004800 [Bacidia gigantensis]
MAKIILLILISSVFMCTPLLLAGLFGLKPPYPMYELEDDSHDFTEPDLDYLETIGYDRKEVSQLHFMDDQASEQLATLSLYTKLGVLKAWDPETKTPVECNITQTNVELSKLLNDMKSIIQQRRRCLRDQLEEKSPKHVRCFVALDLVAGELTLEVAQLNILMEQLVVYMT